MGVLRFANSSTSNWRARKSILEWLNSPPAIIIFYRAMPAEKIYRWLYLLHAMRAFAIDDKHFVPRILCHPGGGHLAPRRKSSIVDPVKTGNLGASSTLPVTARCRTIFGRSVGVAVQMRTPRSRLISSAALLCATHVATASLAADVQIDVFNYCAVENVSPLFVAHF